MTLPTLVHKVLAKSGGDSLYDHSCDVAGVAVEMAKQVLRNPNDQLVEWVRKGALLHDVGKCCAYFQKRLNNEDPDENKSVMYRHNEVGWAFLQKYLNETGEALRHILDAVYWHHGITNKVGEAHADDILAEVPDDIECMKEYVRSVLGNNAIRVDKRGSQKAPRYFCDERDATSGENNEYKKMFVRSCVISADRLVSSLGSRPVDIEALVLGETKRQGNMTPTLSPYEGERFESQKAMASKANKTVIIKAPAGFGKTLVALLWAMRNDKKVIWVCPRNSVAESVYHSILKELGALGISDITVELFLSGKRLMPTPSDTQGFESDIIVTNIDSFLFPTIRNAVAHRQFFINNCDVVFDEFHEVIDVNALFVCFINAMRVRHRLTSSRTLLLSATPISMSRLWDGGEKTLILPDNDTHFKAAHGMKYKVNIIQKLPDLQGGANLVVVNSILMAQRLKLERSIDKIVHSAFESQRRAEIFNEIIREFGKDSPRVLSKSNVISVLILQASLDVSFAHLYESVISPESTLQRIGRCNRWGDYFGFTPTLNFFFDGGSGDRQVRDILYDVDLSYAWFETLRQYDGAMITLDEFYGMYNDFAKNNKDKIARFINRRLRESERQLQDIYPRQVSKKKSNEIKHADSNPLRSSGNQVFYITEKAKDGTFTETFTYTLRKGNVMVDFNVDGDARNMEKAMQRCIKKEGNRYEFEAVLKKHKHRGKLKFIDWNRLAKFSNTPIIRLDKVYDEEYGLISKDFHKKLNENKKRT